MKIPTKNGDIELDELTVIPKIFFELDKFIIVTEWYWLEDLVRRDVNINLLSGLQMNNIPGAIN